MPLQPNGLGPGEEPYTPVLTASTTNPSLGTRGTHRARLSGTIQRPLSWGHEDFSRFVVDRRDEVLLDTHMTNNEATTEQLITMWTEFSEVFASAIGRSESGRMLAAQGMSIIEAELNTRGLVAQENEDFEVIGWVAA